MRSARVGRTSRDVVGDIATAIPVVGAALLWGWLALSHHGTIWPDEIHQSLEQGHRLAFGYGFVPWEYQLGARSWVFPASLAAVLKVASLLGADDPQALVACAKSFMVAVSLAALVATIRLAGALGGRRAGVLAGVLGATFPPIVLFAGRCLSELPSAAAVGFAALMVVERRHLRLAGALAGLAVILRIQNGLLALGLLLCLFQGGHRQAATRRYLEGLGVALAAGGLLDWMAFGHPFQSAWVYLRYNLVEGRAADYGVTPPTFYLTTLWATCGPVVVALALGLLGRASRHRALLGVVAGYLLAHSLVSHKELRFLLPIFPLAIALAAAGLDPLATRLTAAVRAPRVRHTLRAAGWALAGLAAVWMAIRAPRLTFADIGRPEGERGSSDIVWRRFDSHNRLLMAAGRAPDLCGLVVVGPPVIWLGGYGYLHRDVPFFDLSFEAFGALEAATPLGANYAIVPGGLVAAGTPTARAGGLALIRVRSSCGPPPETFSRLFPLP